MPEQPIAQPAVPQQPPMSPMGSPIAQPTMTNPATQNTPTDTGSNKKKWLIVGGVVGAIAIVAVVVVLLIVLLGGGGKTVSCSVDQSFLGINMSEETNIKVTDNGVSGVEAKIRVDLKT